MYFKSAEKDIICIYNYWKLSFVTRSKKILYIKLDLELYKMYANNHYTHFILITFLKISRKAFYANCGENLKCIYS